MYNNVINLYYNRLKRNAYLTKSLKQNCFYKILKNRLRIRNVADKIALKTSEIENWRRKNLNVLGWILKLKSTSECQTNCCGKQ